MHLTKLLIFIIECETKLSLVIKQGFKKISAISLLEIIHMNAFIRKKFIKKCQNQNDKWERGYILGWLGQFCRTQSEIKIV